jgi:hypothetical protein
MDTGSLPWLTREAWRMQYDTEGARHSLGDLRSEEYAKYGSPRIKEAGL